MDTQTASITVFYDGSCPLCRKEIDFYRRQRGADTVHWKDISVQRTGDVAPGLSCEAAMARFHVRLADGQMVSGGDAFGAMWRQLPRFRPLGSLFALPGLRNILNWGYDCFLRYRPRFQRYFVSD